MQIILIFGICVFVYAFFNEIKISKNKKFIKQNKTKNKKTLIKIDFKKFKKIFYINEKINIKSIFFVFIFCLIVLIINQNFLQFNNFLVLLVAFLCAIKILKELEFKKLQNDFDENFAQMLVVLNGSLSSGANIINSLQDCSVAINGVLKKELSYIVKAISLGDDFDSICESSYKRLPFKNYYFFLISLKVSLNQGAKLKEILKQMLITQIATKALEKKKNAMTSEARMSSKITAGIPFCFLFLMKFISPQNFDFILHDESGRYILYYFLGSECLGMLIIMYLMRKI